MDTAQRESGESAQRTEVHKQFETTFKAGMCHFARPWKLLSLS